MAGPIRVRLDIDHIHQDIDCDHLFMDATSHTTVIMDDGHMNVVTEDVDIAPQKIVILPVLSLVVVDPDPVMYQGLRHPGILRQQRHIHPWETPKVITMLVVRLLTLR